MVTPPRKRCPRKPIKLDPAKDHRGTDPYARWCGIKFPHALAPDVRASTIAFAQAMSHPASARPRGDRHYEEGWPENAVAEGVAKLAETVAEPQTYTKLADRDPAMAAEFTRILTPSDAIEIVPAAQKPTMPTTDHAIPRKPAPAEPAAHAQPKSEPSWLRAFGEVLLCAACILIALPSVAVVIDTVIQLAIYLWEPVGHGLKAAAHWFRP